MAKIEQRIISNVESMVKKEIYGVGCGNAIRGGISAGEGKKIEFSEEQKTAIKTATGDSEIAVIQGRAGVGKSTMLAAVRESYEQGGWKVQGIALAGVAAQNLQKESGIESKTIASWLPKAQLDSNTVVIIDEAGMVGSKQMADVIEKVQQARAKLVLVGDEKQLQPIAAGGILHAIDQKVAQIAPQYSSVMEDIKRQREDWMKDVVKLAAQGKTGEALEALDGRNKINIYQTPSEARTALVDEYIKENKNDFSKGIILANIRQDADKINLEIRGKLKEMDIVDHMFPVVCNNGEREIGLAKGDRIMFTRNDYNLGIRNGQRATIDSTDPFGLIDVHLDSGEYRRINVEAYPHIEYGWASTTHKAQGATVERTSVYGFAGESMASQQSTYVQISRAKAETKLFIVAGERGVEREGKAVLIDAEQRKEVLEEMKQSWSHNAAKDTTLEHVQLKQQEELQQERGYERN
jgi:ATP-dependent exoDNAse (exonuclease V) alpha subunit